MAQLKVLFGVNMLGPPRLLFSSPSQAPPIEPKVPVFYPASIIALSMTVSSGPLVTIFTVWKLRLQHSFCTESGD